MGDFFSNIGKSIAQNPGVFVAALAGGIAFGMLGSAFVHSFMLPSMSVGGISIMEGAIMTGVEFGIGGFGAGFASGLASGQSFGNALKNAGYGFAGGFLVGGIVGATYTAGWQSWVHGVDSQKVNNLYSQAENALKSGDLQTYAKAASQLLKMNATAPSGVLAGYSKITGSIDHTYLVAIQKGEIIARGFNPKEFNIDVLLNKRVPGIVTNDKYLIPSSTFSKALTTDVNSVGLVLKNMEIIKFDYYQMLNMKSNCYGWRNTVLESSNIEPPNDTAFSWSH